MDVKRIVFTGGPAGGKTTIINMVKKYLEEKGYNVILVSETATDLIPKGYNYKYLGSTFRFQNMILDYQNFKENKTDNIIDSKVNPNTIILYDRGILDNKAYFENYIDFDYMMEKNNISEIDVLDYYDLVIDLVSTAVCDPQKYTTENNNARGETLEEAKTLDQKTSNAWVGHENLYLFNSNCSIQEEFINVIDLINQLLNNNRRYEKNIIKIDNTLDDFRKFDDNNSRLINVKKLTLNSNSKYTYKIIIREYKNSRSLIFNIYNTGNLISSKRLTNDEYIELLLIYGVRDIISYQSLSLINNLQLFEIKFYENETCLEYIKNKYNDELIYPEEVKFFEKQKKYVKL